MTRNEWYLFDIHVRSDSSADSVAVASQNVNDTWGEAGLLDERAHADGS